jgi:hypothetical protein
MKIAIYLAHTAERHSNALVQPNTFHRASRRKANCEA